LYVILKCVHGDGFVIVEYLCVVLVSSYFSPNREIVYFETLLHELEGQLRRFKKPIVLGADWNAKSPAIGSSTRNAKGNLLVDWMTANNMIVCNQGEIPTCSRGQRSVIDFTARSKDSLLFVQGWRVEMETENFSDHYTIQFNINLKKVTRKKELSVKKWKISPTALEAFAGTASEIFCAGEPKTTGKLTEQITKHCDKTLKRSGSSNPKYLPVYW